MRFLLFSILMISQAFALEVPCREGFGELPVLSGGREKPFYVLASEAMRFVTGKSNVGDISAVVAVCKLSFEGFGFPANIDVPIKVEHIEVKKLLGMNEGDSTIPFSKVNEQTAAIQSEVARIKENNAYKKELNKVLTRLQIMESITAGNAWTFATLETKDGKEDIKWLPLNQYLTPEKMGQAASQGLPDPIGRLFEAAKADYIKTKGDRYLLEMHYTKAQYFRWAMVVTLLALILGVAVSKSALPMSIVTIITLAMQITGMVMRILISGRAPITNMYETVMFSGMGALILGFILFVINKQRLYVLAGLAYNCLCLMMMSFANNMLDPSIGPLVPVLRDNFWLSTHVTTIIFSYAALALSWILANIILIRQAFFPKSVSNFKELTDLIYTCMKFGVVMLAAGIILGGVWADYSWGRFWGWDPKETWSLIVLLVYMAILHGKSTVWIPPHRFVPLVAGAFMSVMMAWFGVNYILATGLHSYGFSEGGAIFLGSFFIVQITILLAATVFKKKEAAV